MFNLKKRHVVTLASFLMMFSVGVLIAQSTHLGETAQDKAHSRDSGATAQNKPKSDFQQRKLGHPPLPPVSDKKSPIEETGGGSR